MFSKSFLEERILIPLQGVLQFQDISLYHWVTHLLIVSVEFYVYNMSCITCSS